MTAGPSSLLDELGDPELESRLRGRLAQVETRLHELVTAADDAAVTSLTSHLAFAGGKRLRPTLTLLAAELGDPDRPGIVDAAVATELTHLASLYHDDVMDAAPTRRGVPAAHVVFDSNSAILAGDWLFARASRVLADLGSDVVRAQAETFERLCAGQLHETFGPAPGEDPIAHHLGVLADKTGALIATSARLGAMLAGCEPVVVEAVVAFGEKAGVAFQLADDLIDLISDGAVSGKTPGTDLREHVPTMPQLLVERRARADRAAGRMDTSAVALSRAMAQDLSSDTRLAEVVAALTKDPAMEQARGVARQWSEDAVAELSPLPEGPVKAALSAFADVMVARLA